MQISDGEIANKTDLTSSTSASLEELRRLLSSCRSPWASTSHNIRSAHSHRRSSDQYCTHSSHCFLRTSLASTMATNGVTNHHLHNNEHEGVPDTLPPYSWQQLHADLERGHFIGGYGGDHAAYHGLAGVRAGINMSQFHSRRAPDETFVTSLQSVIMNTNTQSRWAMISTIDPLGMFATRPTMAATEACMTIPELQLTNAITPDPVVVNADLTINCVKCAIDHVWNLPLLAQRLKMDETVMRQALAQSTCNPSITDTSFQTYLPPIGGVTLYFFGDISKLTLSSTEVAVRVHDECCGSDVFGTDICTCRPYLVFALQAAVECAQRGGVGIIAYFRKEGRSLGEVTKFRVYNARKAQPGGDTPENYFKQTEMIAGIRDARFQPMMPDILLLLGIKRIDWLLSMSSEKYEAITEAGIEVMQRVSLPDTLIPKNAQVEITAKISAGYHTDAVSHEDIIHNLRNLSMIRERCNKIYQRALRHETKHFALDLSKLSAVTQFVIDVTKQTYPNVSEIPYHSRWRHFNERDVNLMTAEWHCDAKERARRLIDLVTMSVLMDAGAGTEWKYVDADGTHQSRSEGLAIATFDMFRDGIFSSDTAQPHRVNGVGLKHMSLKQFKKGLQVTQKNPMVGLDGRFKLIKRIGRALEANTKYFGFEVCRPGNIVDFILQHSVTDPATKKQTVSLKVLWECVIVGFESIWPSHGVRCGDVWVYSPLKEIGHPGSDLVPFHKLSQWLTYSLLEPIEQLGITFTDLDQMTGLAEYRNGGLFVDGGVIVPKRAEITTMEFDVGSELVVEWRALTVCLVDRVWEEIRDLWKMSKDELPLAKILQGGTWSAGRLKAKEMRGDRSSPIHVRSDGTVF